MFLVLAHINSSLVLPMVLLEYCAYVFLAMGLILLLHHGYVHAQDPETSHARQESCGLACYFQIKDISNHETWILICFTNAISLGIIAPRLACL